MFFQHALYPNFEKAETVTVSVMPPANWYGCDSLSVYTNILGVGETKNMWEKGIDIMVDNLQMGRLLQQRGAIWH